MKVKWEMERVAAEPMEGKEGGVAKWLPLQAAEPPQPRMVGWAQPPERVPMPDWWVTPSLLAGHALMGQQPPSPSLR